MLIQQNAVSPYFYSFRILITSQFRDRTFECPGVEGVLRSQVAYLPAFSYDQAGKLKVAWIV